VVVDFCPAQLDLWQEQASPAQVPGAELVGATVIHRNGSAMIVVEVAAYTAAWGAMYRLRKEGAPYPYLAYASDFKVRE
jgi:hypothetical protein